MRRASCRSVPTMCRPPISATLRPSSFIFSLDSMSPTVCFHSSSGTSSRVGALGLVERLELDSLGLFGLDANQPAGDFRAVVQAQQIPLVDALDLVDDGVPLLFLAPVHHIRVVDADERPVRGDGEDVEMI